MLEEQQYIEYKNDFLYLLKKGLILGIKISFNSMFYIFLVLCLFFSFNFLVLNFQKSSLSLDKVIKSVYSGATILKKNVVNKVKIPNQNKKDESYIIFCSKQQAFTKYHFKITEIVVSLGKFSFVVGNLTTKGKNATLLAKKGILSKKSEVFLYNKVNITELNENNIDNIKQFVKINKVEGYSSKIQNNKSLSNKCDDLFLKKSSELTGNQQEIFLQNEKIEEKIKAIETGIEKLKIVNNRED